MTLKARITEDMKSAMRARDSGRLNAIRLILAALKQKEVDERIELDDAAVLGVLDKMLKQRKDSIAQFEAAGRHDLAQQEQLEISVLQDYMPQPLSDEAVVALVDQAVRESGAAGMQDMARVMALVRPQVAGRADMGKVSSLVKARLTAR
ncbi:MAG: GatB/YqeY domain-containing protein [Betaproteobacteria bacterium]|nr:GatB/YqeY domain-containing protein [Betaproteobacteria bacterium]MDE2132816.1 GatB/YqeY domain-containing protein [Betaproteobacteria bacterium]MDE2212001.1 GatB/YqeY domain-containing protein [Betaproteobacteria bacterium]MDE2623887.1 GatB/YqeY domain-containing protein [Betaproteobacteria bacterium]